MIPTLLLVGLVLGKWWRVVIPSATIAWTVWLLATDVISDVDPVLAAAAFAFINVSIGVLVFQGAWSLLQRVAGRHD